jgi:prephenate dehydrogenase
MEKTRVGFIGLGLIGGSIARALRKFHPDFELLAWSRTASTLEAALAEGVIDIACEENDPRFSTCRYIYLCAPVRTNMSYLPFLREILQPGCILTDVGSIKGEMMDAVEEAGLSSCFIGGHPMAGSEKTGFSSSADYLLENAYYVITPSPHVEISAVSDFVDLTASLGAIPLVLTAEEHDYVVAGVSHLPHIVASCLVNAIARLDTPQERMKLVAAGGFRDITRIASSSPVMWEQICLSNTKQISGVLDEYIRLLVQAKYLIDNRDGEGLREMFEHSKNYRDSLTDTVSGPTPRQYVLYCDIYDEAGGIATITTLLAMNGINIKNIGIVHNREFEEGVLRIEFYDDQACGSALAALEKRNYKVRKRQ